jgi:hypothetical protein
MLFKLALAAENVPNQISYTLVASLAALGTLEHLFLMFPLRDAALWQWAAPRTVKVSDRGLYNGALASATAGQGDKS